MSRSNDARRSFSFARRKKLASKPSIRIPLAGYDRPMQVGAKIDETGMLLREGGGFVLRRDVGGRFLLDLRRTPVDEVEKRVRVTGTFVGNDLVDVDAIQLAEPRPTLSVKV